MLQPIGEHLRAAGLMTAEDVANVLDVQRLEGGRFCSIALRRGLCTERALVRTLSRQLNVPGACVTQVELEAPARQLVPRELKERLGAQPDRVYARSVTMLMRDPLDGDAVHELGQYTNRIVRPTVALEGPLMALIRADTLPGKKPPVGSASTPTLAEKRAASLVGMPSDTLDLAIPSPNVSTIPLVEPIPEPVSGPFARQVEHIGPKVLVVTTGEGPMAALARALTSEGYTVLESSPNVPLLERLSRHRPAVVVVDDMYPTARCLDLCQRVKLHADLRQTRVLFLTDRFAGWRAREDLIRTFGFDEVLSDSSNIPFAIRTLSRLVAEVIPGGRVQSAAEVVAYHAFEDGLVALRMGQTEEARKAFEQSIAADPFEARPHFYLGRIHDESGRTFDAIMAYEDAARLEPGYLRVLKALALLHERMGFYHQAAGAWQRALSTCRDIKTQKAIRGHLKRLLR